MRVQYRVLLALAALATLVCVTAAGKLDQSWLTPSGNVKYNKAIYADGAPKFVALTFDDGPGGYTGQIAKVLEQQGVHATFFVIGNRVQGNLAQVKGLAAAGHEVANHSYSHPVMSKLGADSQRKELAQTNAALAKAGIKPAWFRPPYGIFSRNLANRASDMGLETVLWSVDPRDWSKPGAEKIRNRVLRGVSNGGVVLLHCTNSQTVDALPGIIKHLKENGYTFVTMSDWRKAIESGKLPEHKPHAATTQAAAPAPAAAPVKAAADAPAEAAPGGWLGVADAPVEAPVAEDMHPGFYQPFATETQELAGDSVAIGAGAETVVLDEGEAALAAPAEPASAQMEAPTTPAAPELQVLGNFADLAGLRAVLRSGKGRALRVIGPAPAQEASSGFSAVPPSGEPLIADTPIVASGNVPVLPEGEELVIPPSGEEAPANTAEATPQAQPGGEVIAAPVDATQPPAPAFPALGPALDFRVIDLVDMQSPDTRWQPPAQIDPGDLLSAKTAPAADGGLAAPRFYFLSLAPMTEEYMWVELATVLRAGRLSGMVLSNEFAKTDPPCELPYAWTRYCYYEMNRAAMVDLTVENAADVIDVIAGGYQSIFVVVRPSNLNFFIEAHTLAEMERNLKDFILLRQMTEGLSYVADSPYAAPWQLPKDVHLACFSAGNRIALVLYTHDYLQHTVQIPAEFKECSRAVIDPGGWLKIGRLDEMTVTVDATPVILYYETKQR